MQPDVVVHGFWQRLLDAMMGTKRELEGQQDGSKGKSACRPSLTAWFNVQDIGLRALPPQKLAANSHTHGHVLMHSQIHITHMGDTINLITES